MFRSFFPFQRRRVEKLADKQLTLSRKDTKNQATVLERSVRTFADWTPARIRQAQTMADGGNLMYAADLVEAFIADDRIIANLGTRVRGMIKLPLRFDPHEGEKPTPTTDALAEDFWKMYPENKLEELVRWGMVLGVGLARQTWKDVDGKLLPDLEIFHPRNLRWDTNARVWKLATQTNEITVIPGDGNWIMYLPYGEKRPWQSGLWRALSLWWLLKKYATQDWATYGEVHGNPLRVGSTPDNSSKPDRQELAEDLENLGSVTAMALPPGFDVKLVEATARTWETFRAQIETANTAISITISGQNLTSEVSEGSRAAATVHNEIRQDLIESDEQNLSTTLHYQSLVFWTEFNFGNRKLTPWARWDTTPKIQKEIMQYHMEFGVVDVNEVRALLGLKARPDGDVPTVRPDLPQEKLSVVDGKLVRLSGGDALESKGFVRGQLFVDSLVDRAAGVETLQKTLQTLVDTVNAAKNYDELREKLETLFEDLDPDEFSPLMESLMLADLAGRKAVIDDL
jgi:phage gp29-like protein